MLERGFPVTDLRPGGLARQIIIMRTKACGQLFNPKKRYFFCCLSLNVFSVVLFKKQFIDKTLRKYVICYITSNRKTIYI